MFNRGTTLLIIIYYVHKNRGYSCGAPFYQQMNYLSLRDLVLNLLYILARLSNSCSAFETFGQGKTKQLTIAYLIVTDMLVKYS